MTDFNEKISNSLAWLVKSVQDIPYSGDIVELKHTLKDVRHRAEDAYSLVDTELNNTRRIRSREQQKSRHEQT